MANIKPGEEYLGIGLYGPLRIGQTGELDTKAGKDLVIESVKAILSTAARIQSQAFFASGERFMRDDFGNTGKILRHNNLDDETRDLAEATYVEAIEKWEPRAKVVNVTSEIRELEEKLITRLGLEIAGTNTITNLVVIRNAQGKITVSLPQGVA